MKRASILSLSPVLAVLIVLPGAGCAPTYDHRYNYRPKPIDVVTEVPPESFIQVMATLDPSRKAEGGGESLDLQVTQENLPDRTVRLRPGSMALFAMATGDAKVFPQPRLVRTGATEAAAGGPRPVSVAKEGAPEVEIREEAPDEDPSRSWSVQVVDTHTLKTVRALTSVIGLKIGKGGERPAIEVRLWLHNTADAPIRVVPGSLSLVAANLKEFPAAEAVPSTIEVPPGGKGQLTALFRFPTKAYPGSYDLNSLSFRWAIGIGRRTLVESVTFERSLEYLYYSPRY